jgi:pimeloyl-ACP methyl ester carboxylesterase
VSALEPISGRYVSIDGTRTYFDECGSGTPVVCVHAAGADARQYRYLLPLLAEQGFRAIAVDLPGHGRSYPVGWEPTRRIHAHAEFVYRFLQEVCDEPAAAVGCSTGANVVLDLAAHHSDGLLGVVAMEGAAWTPTFPDPAEVERPSWGPSWRDAMERAAISSLGSRTQAPEQIAELRWQHRGAQDSACGDLQGWSNHDLRGKLGALACPVLLIKGLDDFWVPVELVQRTAEEIGARCEVELLEGIGHYPMFEDPEAIARLTTAFLRRHLR